MNPRSQAKGPSEDLNVGDRSVRGIPGFADGVRRGP